MKQVRNKKKRIFSVQITNCDINCGWTVTKAEHLTFQQALDILEQEESEKDSYWNEAAQEPSGVLLLFMTKSKSAVFIKSKSQALINKYRYD